jgi:predicted RNA binding protein YcfA (HicA-like mRNA interferase family)
LNKKKLLEKILTEPKNVQFSEMVTLVEAFGFELTRTKGSHFIFTHPEIPELINLQEKNGKAKPYQVREFL